MRIAHSHGQTGVAQDLLQSEDVPLLLHEVAGEGVAECVGGFALGWFDAGAIQGSAKSVDADDGDASSDCESATPGRDQSARCAPYSIWFCCK